MSINHVILTGRLGRDPELKYTQQGTAVASFSIAVNDNFDREKTYWLNIVTWRKTAESCANYLSKGSHVAVDGRISTRSYENKEGRSVNVFEIVADRVEFLDTKKKNKTDTDAYWDDIGKATSIDDDIPF